jgi:hypothetical protein
MGVSDITVTNSLSASVYTWSTPDGNFVTEPTGTTVRVNRPGTYIVTQQLLDGCSAYASDTVVITHDANCSTLDRSLLSFTGTLRQREARLRWRTTLDAPVNNISLQRSFDGTTFQDIYTQVGPAATENYQYNDVLHAINAPVLYYRLAIRGSAGELKFSPVVRLQPDAVKIGAALYPNPATETAQLSLYNESGGTVIITVRNVSGAVVYTKKQTFSKGHTVITIDAVRHWLPGLYMIGITESGKTEWLKLVVNSKENPRLR